MEYSLVTNWIKEQIRDVIWYYKGRCISNPEYENQVRSFLFVCKGNICRSPFAEQISIKLSKKLEGQWKFSSAGLDVTRSISPPESAINVGKMFGVDISQHRSIPISAKAASTYDRIVAVEFNHLKALRSLLPECENKIILLPLFYKSEFHRSSFLKYNIPDPFGGSIHEFFSCYNHILHSIERLLVASSNTCISNMLT